MDKSFRIFVTLGYTQGFFQVNIYTNKSISFKLDIKLIKKFFYTFFKLIKIDTSAFEDDPKFFCNPLTKLDRFLADIEAIETWTQDWLMKLNTDKCTILYIGKISHLTVNEQKDLGVIITENLKWETHIAQMVKKTEPLVTNLFNLSKKICHIY